MRSSFLNLLAPMIALSLLSGCYTHSRVESASVVYETGYVDYEVPYYGAHPVSVVDDSVGDWCDFAGPHAHYYEPEDPDFYVVDDGFYLFVGDPTYYVVEPRFEVYAYQGHHPVYTSTHWCYIDGFHHHHWGPGLHDHYGYVDHYYVWNGGYDTYYRHGHTVHLDRYYSEHHPRRVAHYEREHGSRTASAPAPGGTVHAPKPGNPDSGTAAAPAPNLSSRDQSSGSGADAGTRGTSKGAAMMNATFAGANTGSPSPTALEAKRVDTPVVSQKVLHRRDMTVVESTSVEAQRLDREAQRLDREAQRLDREAKPKLTKTELSSSQDSKPRFDNKVRSTSKSNTAVKESKANKDTKASPKVVRAPTKKEAVKKETTKKQATKVRASTNTSKPKVTTKSSSSRSKTSATVRPAKSSQTKISSTSKSSKKSVGKSKKSSGSSVPAKKSKSKGRRR